jgi:hypothetical protein
MLFSFISIFYRNLNKTIDILDLISFDNIYLLNDWICEKPNILDEEDL